MYEDYQIAYETNLNEFIVPIMIGSTLVGLFLIIVLISLMKIFKKANRSGIYAFIPIYNLVMILEIVNMPKWQVILFFIPLVQFVVYGKVCYRLAKNFRKTDSFAIMTIFFPMISFPLLAFGDSEYIGINGDALSGKSMAVDLPQITAESQIATAVREVKESAPLDISIGGGVYKKDYEQSLLKVSEEHVKFQVPSSTNVAINPIPVIRENKTVEKPLSQEMIKLEHNLPANMKTAEVTNVSPPPKSSSSIFMTMQPQEQSTDRGRQSEKQGADLFKNIDFIEQASTTQTIDSTPQVHQAQSPSSMTDLHQ
ncbi:MAG: DUF5684 domain-containing protein [bacterium]|nr:DUF5684 domain-containing protein [bacterium]